MIIQVQETEKVELQHWKISLVVVFKKVELHRLWM